MTETYVVLIAGSVPTRRAAVLTGMVRSTATRRRTAATAPTPAVAAQPAPEPVNKLTELERRRVTRSQESSSMGGAALALVRNAITATRVRDGADRRGRIEHLDSSQRQ